MANLRQAVGLSKDNGVRVTAAASVKRVPESTLRDWLKKPDCLKEAPAIGRPTVLDRDDERNLVHYLIECERSFLGYTRDGLIQVAFKLLQLRNEFRRRVGEKERFFGTENGLPSKKWIKLFKKRWPQLAERRPARLTLSQVRSANPEALKAYIYSIGRLAGVTPAHIGNYDEMDAHLTDTGELVFTHRNNKEPARAVKPTYSAHTTFSSTIIADGAMLPHNVIFTGKTPPKPALAGSNPIPGITIQTTGRSGWCCSETL